MPGKCFPLSFAQQIFALKGSVCSASGCGTAAASTGWGHEVLRWAQVQTQHTQAHAGAPQKSWGGAGHGDKCGHGPLRGTEVTKPQRGCGDRWVERVRSLGLSLEPPPPGEKPALAWTVLCPQPQAPCAVISVTLYLCLTSDSISVWDPSGGQTGALGP